MSLLRSIQPEPTYAFGVVFRVVKNAAGTDSLPSSYNLKTFVPSELDLLFDEFYDSLLRSVSFKFSRSRAYGSGGLDVEVLLDRLVPILAGHILASSGKGEPRNSHPRSWRNIADENVLGTVTDDVDGQDEVLHQLRLLSTEKLRLLCLPLLEKPKRGQYSSAYFAYLLTLLLQHDTAFLVIRHIFPGTPSPPPLPSEDLLLPESQPPASP